MWDIGGVYIYIHNYHGYPLITHLLFGILMAWRLLNPDSILFVSISTNRCDEKPSPKAKSFQLALWTLTTSQTLGTNLWEASNETQKVSQLRHVFLVRFMWGSLFFVRGKFGSPNSNCPFCSEGVFWRKKLGKSKPSIVFGNHIVQPEVGWL